MKAKLVLICLVAIATGGYGESESSGEMAYHGEGYEQTTGSLPPTQSSYGGYINSPAPSSNGQDLFQEGLALFKQNPVTKGLFAEAERRLGKSIAIEHRPTETCRAMQDSAQQQSYAQAPSHGSREAYAMAGERLSYNCMKLTDRVFTKPC